MPYTLDEIREKIAPIAQKYNIKTVWVFGSYARGEATETSDVDLVVDLGECPLKGVYVYRIFDEMEAALGLKTDIISNDSLFAKTDLPGRRRFDREVLSERTKIYDSVA